MASTAKRPRYSESDTLGSQKNGKSIGMLRQLMKQFEHRLQKLEENVDSSLQPETNKLTIEFTSLTQELERIASKMEQVQIDIDRLQNTVDELTRKVEDLEERQQKINLGQLATVFERNVSKFLLKPDVLVDDYGGFKYMLQIVKAKEEDLVNIEIKSSRKHCLGMKEKIKIQKQKKESWEKFQDLNNLAWTPKLYAAIKSIKEDRNQTAHPKLDYDQMKEKITTCCENNEELVLQILELAETLNSVLGIGHCATKFEEAVVRFVFPEEKISFANMIKRLNEKKSSKNASAKKLWVKLSAKSWTKEHYEALEELKKLERARCILQNVDFNRAESDVKKFVPESHADHCSDIIRMIRKLPQLTGEK